jgi:hypothetical protein
VANDWIMKRKKLFNDSRTVGISRLLGCSRQHVLGCLDLLWGLADSEAEPETGALSNYSAADIDQVVHHKGFAQAVVTVTANHKDGPWLVIHESHVVFPEYTDWNGEPAKKRGKERKRKDRGKFSAPDAEKTRNRGEERKEEKANAARERFDFQRDVVAFFPVERRTNPTAALHAFNELDDTSKAAVVFAVAAYAEWFATIAQDDQRWAPGLHSFVKNGVYAEGRATWDTRIRSKMPEGQKWGWG